MPSEPQQKLIKKLITEKKVSREQLVIILNAVGADVDPVEGWITQLTGGKGGTASALIDFLTQNPLPSIEHPSDVPDGSEGFVHPAADPSGTPLEAA